MTTPPLTGDALRAALRRPHPAPLTLTPAEVAAIVAAYAGGASIKALARRFHRDSRRVASALRAAGVTIRTYSESAGMGNAKRETPVRAGFCRACGILFAKAGCGHHDGVCCECWEAAAGMVREGETLPGALERWIRETTENDVDRWIHNILERRAA